MNRTILFRGKRIDNGEWVCGFLTCMNYIDVFTQKVCYDGQEELNYCTVEHCQVDKNTVGQFTGLCDKNSNKIFEGDILLEEEKEYLLEEYGEKVVGTHNLVVYWNKKACGFWVRRTDKPKGKIYVPEEPLCESFAEELEAVGNIYDNPKLLEA